MSSAFLAFGVSQAVSSDLDAVICNAMKGMQEQEEKKIPYDIGNYTLTSLTVDCEKKALITEQKHATYTLSEFAEDYRIISMKNWKDSNCKNMIFNTDTGWSTTQIIRDINDQVVIKKEANFEICSQ